MEPTGGLVMIVEDDEDVRELVREILEHAGFETVTEGGTGAPADEESGCSCSTPARGAEGAFGMLLGLLGLAGLRRRRP